jgi:hypothetical protein
MSLLDAAYLLNFPKATVLKATQKATMKEAMKYYITLKPNSKELLTLQLKIEQDKFGLTDDEITEMIKNNNVLQALKKIES